MKIKLPSDVELIINTLYKNGFEAFIVGGCVRDQLLGKSPNDWDITSNALPEQIIEIFPHTIPTGVKHGTVTVIIGHKSYEVTTYRIDGTYTDHRRPDEVIFTSHLEEDLSRRDFTINAMAYNVQKGIIDPFCGQQHLKQKLIRCVGSPTLRFQEDSLRMLRAIRFSSQLQFSIDQETLSAIHENKELIHNVSQERIRDEICKILLSPIPSIGMNILKNSGLLEYILPEVFASVNFNQRNPHHDKDIFTHTLSVMDQTPNRLIVRLAALFHDIGKPTTFTVDEKGIGHFYNHQNVGAEITSTVLKRLRFDHATIEKVTLLVQEHMSHFDNLNKKGIKKLITRVGPSNLEDLFDLQTGDIRGSASPYNFKNIERLREESNHILHEKEPLTVKDLAIKGTDLIALGIKPGREIGVILNHLLESVLENPEKNENEILIKEAKSFMK